MSQENKKFRRAARDSLIALLAASAIFLVAVVLTAGGLVPVWWIAPPSLLLAAATAWSWQARVWAEALAINAGPGAIEALARELHDAAQEGGWASRELRWEDLPVAVSSQYVCLARRAAAIGGRTGAERPPAPKTAVAVVVDFLSAWRFCPLARSENASQGDFEDAAKQLLDALAEADATPSYHHVRVAHVRVARELLRQAAPAIRAERSTRLDGPLMSVLDALDELEKADAEADHEIAGLRRAVDAGKSTRRQLRQQRDLARDQRDAAIGVTTECALRLADALAVLAAVPDDATLEADDATNGLLSALDHALTGSPGCLDAEEFAAKRDAALGAQRERMSLALPTVFLDRDFVVAEASLRSRFFRARILRLLSGGGGGAVTTGFVRQGLNERQMDAAEVEGLLSEMADEGLIAKKGDCLWGAMPGVKA
jgi:hypothetical protein